MGRYKQEKAAMRWPTRCGPEPYEIGTFIGNQSLVLNLSSLLYSHIHWALVFFPLLWSLSHIHYCPQVTAYLGQRQFGQITT